LPLRILLAVCTGIGMIFFATKMAAFAQAKFPKNVSDVQDPQLGTPSTGSANAS
jgi:hypothetical protein